MIGIQASLDCRIDIAAGARRLQFIEHIQNYPYSRAADQSVVATGHARWLEWAGDVAADENPTAAIAQHPNGRRLLDGIFANSPFLTQLCLREQACMVEILQTDPAAVFDRIIADLQRIDAAAMGFDPLMQTLRVLKRRGALAIAVADLTDDWPLEKITAAITQLAETALAQAFRHALTSVIARGRLPAAASDDGVDDCLVGSGLICLAMGKMGAYELNYSSDIDIIVLYDNELPHYADFPELQRGFVEVTRLMVRLMEERTGDGYVFRTDLRLRPDPGATPIAISTTAAENYYESTGQNWERAAMIKARVIACDSHAGARFLGRIAPFVWRKYLDFASIQDIHSIKRQIAAHKGGSMISVDGHNLKLGRGGIREIEFYAQTQQLIWGGRNPQLRARDTVTALKQLALAGHTTDHIVADLIAAYGFLRRVEHRLQMVADAQTHSLPETADEIARMASFLGYRQVADFRSALLANLACVADHYQKLFDDAPSLAASDGGTAAVGNLVFTGSENDPDTVTTLQEMGFADGQSITTRIRQWHHGRYRATRSERSRQILTELMPRLLTALVESAQPDDAFSRFDRFLEALPSGVQIFSLFLQNPNLLEIIAKIMGMAPSLSEYLCRHPQVFEGILTHDALAALPSRQVMTAELAAQIDFARDYEHILDLTRRWVADRRFQIAVQQILMVINGDQASSALAAVADTAIITLLPAAETDMAERHGRILAGDSPAMAVLALGKLGAGELTVGSDLDLIFLYDAPLDAQSDGPKPLPASVYFTRLGQRLLTALTVKTAEGELFDVDLRLRPDGQKAPLATSLSGFKNYHLNDAWTWEKMALTRARVVTGPKNLRAEIETFMTADLCRPRDAEKLLCDVAEMRARIARERPAESYWQVKDWRGGLLDVEFLAQYLILRFAADQPQIIDGNTAQAFEKITAAGLIDAAQGELLSEAARTWRRLQAILRLTLGNDAVDPNNLPADLKARMLKARGTDRFADLEADLYALGHQVQEIFTEIIEIPAAELRAAAEC